MGAKRAAGIVVGVFHLLPFASHRFTCCPGRRHIRSRSSANRFTRRSRHLEAARRSRSLFWSRKFFKAASIPTIECASTATLDTVHDLARIFAAKCDDDTRASTVLSCPSSSHNIHARISCSSTGIGECHCQCQEARQGRNFRLQSAMNRRLQLR